MRKEKKKTTPLHFSTFPHVFHMVIHIELSFIADRRKLFISADSSSDTLAKRKRAVEK